MSFLERFWSKVDKPNPITGCMVWTASVHNGFGQINVGGRNRKPHRLAYELHFRVVLADASKVIQACQNKLCCNPSHLRLDGEAKPGLQPDIVDAESAETERAIANRRERELEFWNLIDQPNQETGCREWLGSFSANGYGQVSFMGQRWPAHRLAYTLAKGPIPRGLHLMHSCDNSKCCNPDHLSVGTIQENQADKVAKGRQARGESQHLAKLTEEIVLEIRALHAAGVTQVELGKQFGVLQTTISRVILRQTWKHV